MVLAIVGGVAQMVGGAVLLIVGLKGDRGGSWNPARTAVLFGAILLMSGLATIIGGAVAGGK